MLSQRAISVLRSCGRTAARPVTAAPAIRSGAQKPRHRSWRVVARRNPLRLRRLRQCSTSGPPPQITNGEIPTRMGRPSIRGHGPIRRLDATAIDGMATEAGERDIIAQAGIVIVIVMLRRHRRRKRPNGGRENRRKKRLSTSHQSFRGSSAHCQDRVRSMVSGPICGCRSLPVTRTLTTLGRTCVPHGRPDASVSWRRYSKRDRTLSESTSSPTTSR